MTRLEQVALENFRRVAVGHRFEDGAFKLAAYQAVHDPDARRIYSMLSVEKDMPLTVGERVRRPVLSTIRRRAKR